jgi:hypothetical protein
MPVQDLVTASDMILKEAAASGSSYNAEGMTYYAIAAFLLTIDHQAANGRAIATLEKQEVPFFNVGRKQQGPSGLPNTNRLFTDVDTNLAKARSTNGAARMAIESISLAKAGVRMIAEVEAGQTLSPGLSVLPAWKEALDGTRRFVDRAAAFAPLECGHPVFLEDVFSEEIRKAAVLDIDVDSETHQRLGLLSQFPCGDASSFLRAQGEPMSANRFNVPAGILWDKDGEADADIAFIARVPAPVTFALAIPTNGFDVSEDPAAPKPLKVSHIAVEFLLRLHGVQVSPLSRNS